MYRAEDKQEEPEAWMRRYWTAECLPAGKLHGSVLWSQEETQKSIFGKGFREQMIRKVPGRVRVKNPQRPGECAIHLMKYPNIKVWMGNSAEL